LRTPLMPSVEYVAWNMYRPIAQSSELTDQLVTGAEPQPAFGRYS